MENASVMHDDKERGLRQGGGEKDKMKRITIAAGEMRRTLSFHFSFLSCQANLFLPLSIVT